MADAKPQGASAEQDPSMEEILQSIRRIIAEEDKEGAPANGAAKKDASGYNVDVANIGTDVLELTEMVDEGGAGSDMGEESAMTAAQAEEAAAGSAADIPSAPVDILANIDSALAEPVPEIATPEPAPAASAPSPAPTPADPTRYDVSNIAAPVAERYDTTHMEQPIPERYDTGTIEESTYTPTAYNVVGETLLSEAAAAEAAAAFRRLSPEEKQAAARSSTLFFRSGTTVEDLVIETMRPMIKDWLDSNLPQLVREVVEREVARIAGKS